MCNGGKEATTSQKCGHCHAPFAFAFAFVATKTHPRNDGREHRAVVRQRPRLVQHNRVRQRQRLQRPHAIRVPVAVLHAHPARHAIGPPAQRFAPQAAQVTPGREEEEQRGGPQQHNQQVRPSGQACVVGR